MLILIKIPVCKLSAHNKQKNHTIWITNNKQDVKLSKKCKIKGYFNSEIFSLLNYQNIKW